MTENSLLPSDLRASLLNKTIARRIYYWPAVDSTNRAAVALAAHGELDGTLVATDRQFAGKGRQGRSWESTTGKDLAFSLILRPDVDAAGILTITLAFSAAIADALAENIGCNCHVKWPNDVTVNGRKVCGILSESATEGARTRYVVVGIGINVNSVTDDFPSEIRGTTTTCASLVGSSLDRTDILVSVLHAIDRAYAGFVDAGFAGARQGYLQKLDMLGRDVTFELRGARCTATVETVADDGALVVRLSDGSQRALYDEEVHFLDS